jgi:hypothetical protein
LRTENVSTLKINKLSQEQYDRELAAGNLEENAIYLTPDEEIDLSSYIPCYTTLADIGLTSPVTTEQICEAMPFPSRFLFAASNVRVTDLPANYGTIEISRVDTHYCTAKFTQSSNSALHVSFGKYAANTSPKWSGWEKVYTSNNKPTISEIGAAPAGFGLGATAGKTVGDCNDALLTGWYVCGEGCVNTPDAEIFRYSSLQVVRRNSTVYQTITSQGITVHRWATLPANSTTWTWREWEWENPPMVPGVVYKTTKRYNGKAVYTILQDLGNLPAKGTSKEIYLGSGSSVLPTNYLSYRISYRGGGRNHMGNILMSNDEKILARACIIESKTIELISFAAVSDYTAQILAEYTIN